jgi:hypothetical protein
MKTLYVACLIIWTFSLNNLAAQEGHEEMENRLENLAAQAEDLRAEDWIMPVQWEHYTRHPLNLNSAGEDELNALGMLTPLQVHHLLEYRRLLGNLISVYELQAVPGWDIPSIRKLLPYISVSVPVNLREDWLPAFRSAEKFLVLRWSRKLEQSADPGEYFGDANHLLMQLRAGYKNVLHYGFTAEKDAGEPLRGGPAKGFDFYSFHVFTRGIGRIKALALGDFSVNMGQGLIQWHSMGFGKSAEVMSVKRQSPVLAPYRSSGEYYFFRGAGLTMPLKNVELTVFGSSRRVSASVAEDSSGSISAFRASGYHRTASEIEGRNRAGISSVGVVLKKRGRAGAWGLNAIAHRFSAVLEQGSEVYNQFRMSGEDWYNASIDYSHTHRNVHYFGEAAVAKGFYPAVVQGLLAAVDPKVDLSIVYRNIHPRYQSAFGNAFAESGAPSNEKGVFTGVVIRPMLKWQISAYADIYIFPWLKYRVDAPSRGSEQLVQVSYNPNKMSAIYLRYRVSFSPGNGPGGVMEYAEMHKNQNFRVHVSSKISRRAEFRIRFDVNWFDRGTAAGEEGFGGYVEGRFQPLPNLWVNMRLHYFETMGSNSRVYAYESDVLYSYGTAALSGTGYRYYMNLKYNFSKKVDLWLRLAHTAQRDVEKARPSIGNTRPKGTSEAKMQVRYLL